MSTNSRIERQNSNIVPPTYGPFGPFASPEGRPLANDEFGHILSFFEPKDLALAEGVCRSWNRFINETDQWKRRCQIKLGVSSKTDPKKYLPECPSYKEIFREISSRILGKDVYELYIGKVGPVPRIPKKISLKKWNKPDPCDPTKTIGSQYFWMYCPSDFEIETNDFNGFSLDKPDDPNDPEAPKLIEAGFVKRVVRRIARTKSENKVLKVPMTINNIVALFKHPKTGNPSTYAYIWDKILEQHGNKRIPAGWVCMREDVFKRNQSFTQQRKAVAKAGVKIPQLGHRILFDFLRHAETNTYPDGLKPWTFARTSTRTHDSKGNNWVAGCGFGGLLGLRVGSLPRLDDNVGVAVALPAKVRAIGHF